MPKVQRGWVYSPGKATPSTIPPQLKAEVERKAQVLIEEYLKPTHLEPPPEPAEFNYLSAIGCKWYRNYFYFVGTYTSPGPYAIVQSFESRFARLTYTGGNHFTLCAMRHTSEWLELYQGLTLDECLNRIREDAWFHP